MAGPIVPGTPAPGFEAINITSGSPISSAQFEGDVVLLHIWATWCVPCDREMRSLEQLYRELGSAGLKIVAVSLDRESRHKVRLWTEERGLSFTVLQDPSQRIERLFQLRGVPESFVIDREGRILARVIGPRDWDTPAASAVVRDLLSES